MATVVAGNNLRHLWGLWPSRNRQPRDGETSPPNALNSTTCQPTVGPSGQASPDLYATVRKIPYLKETVYIYPDAQHHISQDHQTRFRVVKEILQKNVEYDSKLRHYTRDLSYELHMCGASQVGATSSIVVFCPKVILKKLKALLTKSHVKEQYHLDYETAPLASSVPRFKIFFWGEPREPLWGRSTAINLDVDGEPGPFSTGKPSGLTMCGTVVTAGEYGERCSTIGCVLQAGCEYYGFTSAHAFEDFKLSSTSLEEESDAGDSGSEDDEYDLDLEFPEQPASNYLQPPFHQDDGKPGLAHLNKTLQPSEVLLAHKASNQLIIGGPLVDNDAWSSNNVDRDWALIPLTEPQYWRPNVYFSPSKSQKQIFFSKVASCHPGKKTSVSIVSSRSVSQRGTLHPISSYIGSNGIHTCEVWTVSLSDNDLPRKGDSGSLVIDSRTKEVYGHVVAVNPLGNLYVVPFKDTIRQIKDVLGKPDVSLPDNLQLLLHLLVLYSSKSQRKEQGNVFKALRSIQQRDRANLDLAQSLLKYLHSENLPRNYSHIGHPNIALEPVFVSTPSDYISGHPHNRRNCKTCAPFLSWNTSQSSLLKLVPMSTIQSSTETASGMAHLMTRNDDTPHLWDDLLSHQDYQVCGTLGGNRYSTDNILPVAGGSFSLVYKLDLCTTHYNRASICSCQEPRIQAVCKMPRQKNESERQQFDTEWQALTLLQQFSHPHIINLLGSYQARDTWGIFLPMAECDLDAFMSRDRPTPGIANFAWVLHQLSGIASALDLMHTGMVEVKKSGWHGDIKPSNILILQNSPEVNRNSGSDPSARWVLSDFGLSRFRERHEPKSPHAPEEPMFANWNLGLEEILSDRLYIAPETEIKRNSSPASDIWSFGCVLTEVLVWLLYGQPGRTKFLLELSSDGSHHHPFWITTETSQVKLRPSVLAWIERLEIRAKRNAALTSVVNLLHSGNILNPEPRKRATAAVLAEKLRQSSQRADMENEDLNGSDDDIGGKVYRENTEVKSSDNDSGIESTSGNENDNAASVAPDRSTSSVTVTRSEVCEVSHPSISVKRKSSVENENNSLDDAGTQKESVDTRDQPLQLPGQITSRSPDTAVSGLLEEMEKFNITDCFNVSAVDGPIVDTENHDSIFQNSPLPPTPSSAALNPDAFSKLASTVKTFASSYQTTTDSGQEDIIVNKVANKSEKRLKRLPLPRGHSYTTSSNTYLQSRPRTCSSMPIKTDRTSSTRMSINGRKRSRSESRDRSTDPKPAKRSLGLEKEGENNTTAPPRMRSGGVVRFRSGDYNAGKRFLGMH